MHKMTLCAALAAATISIPTVASGLCAMARWSPQLIAPANQPLPKTGGVLVGVVQSSSFKRTGRAPGLQPSVLPLRLERGKRKVELEVQWLAPGLSRYVPKVPVRGTWSLVGLDAAATVQFSPGAGAHLPAPWVHEVETSSKTYRARRGMRTSHSVSAQIKGTVPRDVVGVIVYGQSSKPVPLLFARVPAGTWSGNRTHTVRLYSSPGRCGSDVPGTQRPLRGQTVKLRWVDRFGQLSPLSNPARVIER